MQQKKALPNLTLNLIETYSYKVQLKYYIDVRDISRLIRTTDIFKTISFHIK